MTFSNTSGANTPEGRAEILGSRVIHQGWGRFLMARLRLPDGTVVEREIEDHGSAAAVLPYDPERRIVLLVRQMRTPLLFAAGVPSLLEAPAGRLDEADPGACAIREAFEETGVRLSVLEPVAAAWSMASVSTERLHLFLAPFRETDEVGPGGGLADEGEAVAVERVALSDLDRMVTAGEVVDLKTLALALALRHRRPELFARTAASEGAGPR